MIHKSQPQFRRFVSCLFLLLAAGLALSQQVYAEDIPAPERESSPAGAIVVSAPTTFAQPATSITIDISTTSTTGENITGFESRIQFDPAVLNFTGCTTAGTIFSSASANCNLFPDPQTIATNVFGITAVSGSGPILRLNFQVVGSLGTVSPLNFIFFQYNEGIPASTTVNGSVTVASLGPTASLATVAGRVLDNNGYPVRNARLTIMDGDEFVRTSISNSFGYFRFSDIPVGHLYVIETVAKGRNFESVSVPVSDDVSGIVIIAGP